MRSGWSPARTSAHLLVFLLPADVVDADPLVPKIDAGKVLPADVGGSQVDGLFEDVFLGDGIDHDDVV